ncbi:ATP-binding protein [Polyangium jinanense]|uniref:histidine kinase n=1 Tax=Polyangium jinanense TaxID=2829994 RepID=A0A9X3XEV2_9BACT|nr:ATP-binding protein [Polyangium jinanense]MDC3958189.1 GAF domain-containing protein [Polyangium jinanense]MDC3988125.1 GAF domain-containing protein [Polyangium jinanense]
MGTTGVEIPREITDKWQEIVDLLAEILQIPAALIVKIEPPEMVVVASSESRGNPYPVDERACTNAGYYCEAVMSTRRPLLIADALSDEKWRSSPDASLGLISYLGFPILWPGGDVFGTICVLDCKKNAYSDVSQRLLVQFRQVIEADLRSLLAIDARLREEAQAKERLEAQVAERTAELTRINAQLARDIAERRRAEKALRANQQLLQAIIDNSTAVIYVKDREGRYLFVNRHFEELFRVTREGIIGMVDYDVFPAECADAFRAIDERVFATGSAVETEAVAPHDDGLHTYITLKFPLRDNAGAPYAVCGISTDITERKRIEEERIRLLAQEQQARAAAEEAERRAAFLAEAGALLAESLDYNETLARLGKLCVQSLSDWCVIDVVEGREIRRISGAHKDPAKEPLLDELRRRYPPRWDSPHPAARVLRTGQPILLLPADLTDEAVRQFAVDDGHVRLSRALGTGSSMIVPLVARGQTLGVLSIVSSAPGRSYDGADLELVTDVTRRAAIAIDNARLYREAQETARIREDLVSIASPEVCTPLTPLKLQLQLVDSVLDVSRIAQGQFALELEEVDLPALVRGTVDRFQELLAKAGSRSELRAELGVTGRWDRLRIEQVVVNLLSNAIKFGLGRPIEIRVMAYGGLAILSVQDHGLGIVPEDHERIFGRFERCSGKSLGGLGLGLYVAREIVAAHGGAIRLTSEPGVGSCFSVELPRDPSLSGFRAAG